jgi:Arc/MetJ-type ribon-helix-helix transcriptional regulator
MAYEIPTDIRERVKARLDEGAYQSEDEVLRDAMDALEQRELDRVTRWNERNQLAIEQSQQGLSKPLDDGQVLTRLRERLAKEGILG